MSKPYTLRKSTQRILDCIVNCRDVGTTKTEIRKSLHISESSASNAVELLRKRGLVFAFKHRRFSRLFPSQAARDAGIEILMAHEADDSEITVVNTDAVIYQGLMNRSPLEMAWLA